MNKILLFCVLLLSGCGEVSSSTDTPLRQITVNGVGSVTSVPDRFHFTVVIEERGAEASKLNALVNEKTATVIEQLLALDVPEKNIQSLQVQFNPWIEYLDQREIQKGFILVRQIQVTLEQLSQYDQAIDKMLTLNITRIQGFNYSNSQAHEHYQSTIERALLDAQVRAEKMAKVLGLNLGKALSVNEQSQSQAPTELKMMAMRSRVSSDSMPGEMDTSANVSVVFELEN
jgi:uncharacterized protein